MVRLRKVAEVAELRGPEEWSRLDRKMNKIVRRYLAEKSEKRALRMLARMAGRMGAELMKGE
ncbi:MAG: hypothetical protein QXI18_04095 [Nitrososphaerota archaeon]